MKVLIINLDRDIDRYFTCVEQIQSKLKQVNDPVKLDIQRLGAIDTTQQPLHGDKEMSAKESGSLPLTLGAAHDTFVSDSRRYHRQLSGPGGIGCYLSHMKAWKIMLNDPTLHYIVILEDDCVLSNINLFNKAIKAIENDGLMKKINADVLLLGYLSLRVQNQNTVEQRTLGIPLRSVDRPFFGTMSYCVSRKGAEALLNHALPIEMQVDAYMGLKAMKNVMAAFGQPYVSTFAIVPSSSAQSAHASDTQRRVYDCHLCDISNDSHATQIIEKHAPGIIRYGNVEHMYNDKAQTPLKARQIHVKRPQSNMPTVRVAYALIGLAVGLMVVCVVVVVILRSRTPPCRQSI